MKNEIWPLMTLLCLPFLRSIIRCPIGLCRLVLSLAVCAVQPRPVPAGQNEASPWKCAGLVGGAERGGARRALDALLVTELPLRPSRTRRMRRALGSRNLPLSPSPLSPEQEPCPRREGFKHLSSLILHADSRLVAGRGGGAGGARADRGGLPKQAAPFHHPPSPGHARPGPAQAALSAGFSQSFRLQHKSHGCEIFA